MLLLGLTSMLATPNTLYFMEEQMTNIFQNIFKYFNEERLEKIRKYFLLASSIICGFLMLIVLFVPYLEYGLGDGEIQTLTPIKLFYLLQVFYHLVWLIWDCL